MKSKLIIIGLLFIFLCSLSAVTAQDSNGTQVIGEISTDNLELGNVDEDMLSADSSNLPDIIKNASEGGTVKLSKNYAPEQTLKIDKAITIDGAGNTIDTSNANIELSKGAITLKNLIFTNEKYKSGIFIMGFAKCSIINCTFKNGHVTPIVNDAYTTLTVINSKFINIKSEACTGGAISSKGMLVVENSTFTNNEAFDDGGAIFARDTVELTNCIFSSNKATKAVKTFGGAVYSTKDIYVENCTFTDNSARNSGGAIYANGNLIIDGSTFIRNTALNGGAIRSNNDNKLSIENSKFINNSASSAGGAVSTEKWVQVENSTFVGNTAQGKGGAIETDFIQLGENVSFIKNSAKDHGGAIYTNTIGNVIKTLRLEGNHVDSDFGGGLYINNKCPDISFYSCVFVNNYAIKGDGGAIHSDSGSTNLKFYSCIFTGNYATGGNEKRYGGAVRSNGNVYVENSTFKDNWAENYGGAIYTENANEIKNSVFISNQVKNGGKRDGGAIYINKAGTTTIIGNYFERNGGAERGGAIYTDSKNAHLKIVNNAFIENSAGEGKAVFNSGKYDEIANNWWGANGASLDNQLKEYHTIGKNEDHKDGAPLTASVSGSDKAYVNVKTTVTVAFQNNLPSYTLNKINYTTNKKGSFESEITGKSLLLSYIPNETGVHTLNFTIDGQKLSLKLNVSYISVYGYDLTQSYGSNTLYSAVFKDKNGSYLSKGTKIIFNVDNVNYTGTVEDKGVAKLYATLEVGNHTVKAINRLTGESFTNKIIVTSVTKQFNIGDVYVMKLEGVINKTISVKLGAKTYNLTTSENGNAYLPLNVSAGNYTVEIKLNGKTVKDNIVVLNKHSIIDLGLVGTSYGALMPVYSNETFTKLSNASMYSVLGENTYRYILGSKQAFILYNVTVSNSEEFTKVLRKISSSDFKADVIMITLKKNTYKITENFWRDAEWFYLIHLTHGKLFIDGGGSTIDDDYHHNFICLEQSSSLYVKNLAFNKFYRVFSNGGDVHCVNVTFNENNAKFFSTKTPGSVIYNKNKATFENCIFNNNKNDDHTWGHGQNTMGGVLYAGGGSITNFVKCQFLSDDDNIRAVDTAMVVFYDDNNDNYKKIIKNSYLEKFSSIDVRKVSSFTKNQTVNFNIASVSDIINEDNKDNRTLFGLLNLANDGSSYNITIKNGQYSVSSEMLAHACKIYEWRGDYLEVDSIPITYHHDLLTVKSKPVVVNGNGATIKITGNSISDDFHFAYIPQHGSLTLINMTVSGFNTAFVNYGTLILINCTFDNNKIHHKIQDWDWGGVIRNYGDVFCYNSTFTNNAANLGGAYYSDSGSSSATFSNCKFTGNVVKSNWVWNNNDENAFYIKKGIVKFVKCSGVNSANIKTDKEGKYSFRENLNNTIYNMTVNNLASLMKLSAIVKDNIEYDIINATFTKKDFGVFPNSHVLLEMDYGLLIINGNGAKVFVQNAKDSDETQFLTTTPQSNVQINNITIEGFNIAISNNGKLKIMNSYLNNNRVDYKFKSDYGGAIVNAGILNVLNTTFANNYAKYGGAVYNTGASKFVMCNFTNNQGYSDNKNIDVYNKEGSVESIAIFTGNPKLFEKHPMAQWRQDLLKSGFKLITLAVTAATGWGIAASGLSCAAVLSTTVNAIIGGSFGAIEGLIYSNDQQDYSTFWQTVVEGVGSGMDFTDIGEAIHELRPVLYEEMTAFALSQIYGTFRSKTVDLVKSLVEAEKKDANYDDIDVYAFFNT